MLMGYDEDTQARAARRKKRKRRQRTMGVLILLFLILVIAGVGYYIVFGNSKVNPELIKNGLGTAGNAVSGLIRTGKDALPDSIKEKLPSGWFETETESETETEAPTETETETENHSDEEAAQLIAEADAMAVSYDYDGAAKHLKASDLYAVRTDLQQKVSEYKTQKAACVAIAPEDVTHVFYHTLVVDPSKAFNPDLDGYAGWQQWMTTISEFDEITQEMYDRGYVLVSIHDLIKKTTNEDGSVTIEPNNIYLPEGKKAFVLSLDDLCYYHTYDNHGVASKIVLDENGKPTCEYVQDDGTVVTGAYDAVPRLDAFLEEHPDGCYKGARGIIALTGYNGILGYRTDGTYSEDHNTNSEVYYRDDLQSEWLANHPDFDWEQECEDAKKVVEAMKADGWEFASHTWGHKNVGETDYDDLVRDTERWFEYVSPLIGETDAIIFAHGADISSSGYTEDNAKYTYFKSKGFDIYCPVDSVPYTTTVTSEYLHQGRRNLDGYRIYNDAISDNPMTADLFDASKVLDPDRPLPVPDL